MNLVPGLKLRADEESEVLGMDDAEIGEFAVRMSFRCLIYSLTAHSMIMSNSPATS